jgi:4'-phosphopantetheinyl transferase
VAGIEDGEVQIWWARLAYAHPGLLSLLNPTERGRRDRYRMEPDRDRFTLGCAVTRLVLARLCGEPAGAIRLDRTCPDCGEPHGKVAVVGHPVQMSLSHSGDLIGVAFANRPVGIDVEQVNRRLDVAQLAPSVLTPAESELLLGLPIADRAEAFIRYWTRKEALVKLAGTGLRSPLRGIEVSAPWAPAALVDGGGAGLAPAEVRLVDLAVDDGYRACLAVNGRDPVTVRPQDAGELLRTVPEAG